MFRSKRPPTVHHYKNYKNKLQCKTNEAHDMGPHKTYKVYTELYQIIGLVTPWTLK